MEGEGPGKKNKTGGRRKRDEMSSVRSENSQGTSEPKRIDNISRMADMTEDDVVTATSEKTANRNNFLPLGPSASCRMGGWGSPN